MVTGENNVRLAYNAANCGFFYQARLRNRCAMDGSLVSPWSLVPAIATACFKEQGDNEPFFVVAPKPANDILRIEVATDAVITDMRLLDVSGREVLTLPDIIPTNQYDLNVANLHVGIYLVSVKTSQGDFVQKVFIQ